jgi:uncharacterized membrane protein
MSMKKQTSQCSVTGKDLPLHELMPIEKLRPQMISLIQSAYPDWEQGEGYISLEELRRLRLEHVSNLLEDERGELSRLDRQALQSLEQAELNAEEAADMDKSDEALTLGERLADKVADFGGSWGFIIFFFSFLGLWIIVNLGVVLSKPFDPYPFILLNLILSCLAAIQAPIIMMSQNRQEAKDRLRAKHDYQVNLRAEAEIRLLHQKLDFLIQQHNPKLLEIEQMKLDMLEEMRESTNKKKT